MNYRKCLDFKNAFSDSEEDSDDNIKEEQYSFLTSKEPCAVCSIL